MVIITVIYNFKKVFGSKFEYNIEYLKLKKGDINDILKYKPIKHTFIFYCEILRSAKTQCKKYIGVSYERFVPNPNDSSIIQGTFGRDTGYDNNGFSICYTNIPSLENYVKLWNNNMEFKKGIIWNTKTTLYNKKDNMTYSTGTFNSVKYIKQLKKDCSEKVKEERTNPNIKRFYGENGQKEMIYWFKTNLKRKMKKGTCCPRKKHLVDRFYFGSIRGGLVKLSTEKVEKEQRWGLKEGPCYRSYPCYLNINDPCTLQWWLIYYE